MVEDDKIFEFKMDAQEFKRKTQNLQHFNKFDFIKDVLRISQLPNFSTTSKIHTYQLSWFDFQEDEYNEIMNI